VCDRCLPDIRGSPRRRARPRSEVCVRGAREGQSFDRHAVKRAACLLQRLPCMAQTAPVSPSAGGRRADRADQERTRAEPADVRCTTRTRGTASRRHPLWQETSGAADAGNWTCGVSSPTACRDNDEGASRFAGTGSPPAAVRSRGAQYDMDGRHDPDTLPQRQEH
jgi:hypothetical protein